jgi:hypothetical protein
VFLRCGPGFAAQVPVANNVRMMRGRIRLLAGLVVLAVADISISLHATLTRASRPTVTVGASPTGAPRPTTTSLGEVLGWGTSFLLVLFIVVVIVDARWVAREKAKQ